MFRLQGMPSLISSHIIIISNLIQQLLHWLPTMLRTYLTYLHSHTLHYLTLTTAATAFSFRRNECAKNDSKVKCAASELCASWELVLVYIFLCRRSFEGVWTKTSHTILPELEVHHMYYHAVCLVRGKRQQPWLAYFTFHILHNNIILPASLNTPVTIQPHHVRPTQTQPLRIHGLRWNRRRLRGQLHPSHWTRQDTYASLWREYRRHRLGCDERGRSCQFLEGIAICVWEGIELYQCQVGCL